MEGLAEYLGNIDLNNRQVYRDPKTGAVMTEYSKSFGTGYPDNPTEVLIPTIVNGRPVTDDEAWQHYEKTGEHLGRFNRNEWLKANPDMDLDAFYRYINSYADKIHKRQGKRYK
jgi:hypothetical protein